MEADASWLNVAVSRTSAGTRIIDCGVKAVGGLEAGGRLAEICLADCGRVEFGCGTTESSTPLVSVRTDQPLVACMASQYAGWQIAGEKFFAMGSGPMRAVARKEPLFEHLGYRERADRVVGILETSKLPTDEVCEKIARDCGVPASGVTLLVARTASIAGTVQGVARTVETSMHKMYDVV